MMHHYLILVQSKISPWKSTVTNKYVVQNLNNIMENLVNMLRFIRNQPKQAFELQLTYHSHDFSLRPSRGQPAQGIQKATTSSVRKSSFCPLFLTKYPIPNRIALFWQHSARQCLLGSLQLFTILTLPFQQIQPSQVKRLKNVSSTKFSRAIYTVPHSFSNNYTLFKNHKSNFLYYTNQFEK